ncbi:MULTISPECIES: hypothetical protein [Duncaniella]|jgi:hypothetical protein|uniref:Uncharacterized protein n=1 Tax=Duncaniella dubosii TaxID=2518971 RepID=A0A4P7VZD0_9BACT|nr:MULTISPECIES: hypothetical protein [Duncaniella]MBJ2190658.1 hypothetical protein [Muribaculaceae bacterium]ROS90413.1 hypothetical protein EEL39_01170 [Muribaculaceae bacterium Isolate-080 (Janvier)]HBN63518.1 hypothetical protein [Porphyromonadaceae bacterium]MCX4283920.1 hypothetical protein [Duncaniella dubosii]QCD40921.1 hypothetical protein E7747_00520 [Duncaniella dubosii]
METKVSVRAHAVIFDKQVYRNCIVSYSPEDNTVVPHIIPFSTEVHSTTSYNGIIIFAPLGFTLPPDLDMPHAIAAPGGYTAFLNHLAEATPACGQSPHSVILLPL